MKVMGIDLGIAKVAFSVWDSELGHLYETAAQSFDFMSRRVDQIYCLADYMASQIRVLKPELIIIEDVLIGNNRKYSLKLAETKGAVLCAIGGSRSVEVIPVNVGKWKKEVIGDGHASKEAIRNYLLERDSAYAELCGSDQDRFDAACIGWYGVILSERAERLADVR